MRKRLAATALLLVVLAYAAPPVDRIACSIAYADELDWNELAQSEEAGAQAFNRAGDTSLTRKQRNAAIIESYGLLKRVYQVLDAHCDANPDQIEALDQRMVNINMMVFWLKKDAPIGIMAAMHAAAKGGAVPTRSGASDSRPEKSDRGTDGTSTGGSGTDGTGGGTSGIGGTSRSGDKPPVPTPTPPAPERADPRPTAPASAPLRPEPPAVPPPVRSPLELARAHEKARPSDVAGAVERWLEVLVSTDDTASAAYTEALGRVSELSGRLKDFYRKRRNEDPDAVKRNDEAGRESAIAGRLSAGLSSTVPEERRATADRLASLGWTPAALAIQSALRREKDAGVRDAMFLALVRLGGSRTCTSLGRFRRERSDALALGAVRSLAALARKGPVEARYAGASLGEFVAAAKSTGARDAALGVLGELGALGVPGLVVGIESKDRETQMDVIAAMRAAADGRAGPPLAVRLTEKVDHEMRTALMGALTTIGRPAVPALIEALKKKKTRRYSAIALYEITSQPHGEDAKAWLRWWREQGDQ